MVTRLFVHVGVAKTGTTALQKFLNRHTTVLARHGVWYPKAGRGGASPENHHVLAISLRDGIPGVVETVRAELDAQQAPIGVISSEIFAQFNSARLLREAFAELDLAVVLFVRPQHTWIESVYRTRVADAGSQWTGLPWHMPIYHGQVGPAVNWLTLTDRYIKVLGRQAVRVHPYDPLRGPDAIFSDLFSDLGVVWPIPGCEIPTPAESNPSLGMEATEFKRLVNHSRRPVEEDIELGKYLARVPRTRHERPFVRMRVRRRIFRATRRSNQRLTHEHFPSSRALLVKPTSTTSDRPFRGLDEAGLHHVVDSLKTQGYPADSLAKLLPLVDLDASRRVWRRRFTRRLPPTTPTPPQPRS